MCSVIIHNLKAYTETAKRCRYIARQIEELKQAEAEKDFETIYQATITALKWNKPARQIELNLEYKLPEKQNYKPIQTTLF